MRLFRSIPCLFFLTFFTQPEANALINCGPKKSNPFKDLVEKVALVGSENRMTFGDYASLKNLDEKEVRELFSATGILKCDQSGGTVQITQSQSVATTAGHIFFDNNCNPKRFSSCKIYLAAGDSYEVFEADLGALKTGECDRAANTNDWAVLKLKKPVPKKFRAYKVNPNIQPLTSKDEITVVAGYARNFQINGKFPPNVSECNSLGRNPNGLIKFDCDTGKGTSGSAIFRRNEVGQFISGIVSTENEIAGHNSATQIEGDFLKAILDAAGER